jgi:hypothetical protein
VQTGEKLKRQTLVCDFVSLSFPLFVCRKSEESGRFEKKTTTAVSQSRKKEKEEIEN